MFEPKPSAGTRRKRLAIWLLIAGMLLTASCAKGLLIGLLIAVVLAAIITLMTYLSGQRLRSIVSGEELRALIQVILAQGSSDLPDDIAKLLKLIEKALYKEETAKQLPGLIDELIEKLGPYAQDSDQTLTSEQKDQLKKLLELLKQLAERLKKAIEDLDAIRKAQDYLKPGTAAPADADAAKKRDEAMRAGVIAAEHHLADDDELPAAHAAAEKLKETLKNKPYTGQFAGTGCDTTQALSDLVFGDGPGVVLAPGCCIVLNFDPPLNNIWYSIELTILSDTSQPSISVTGVRKGGLKSDPATNTSGSTWKLPTSGPYDSVIICNTGSSDVTLRKVGKK